MKYISKEQIEDNKKRFIEIVNSIEREGMRKEALIEKLNNSDFFYTPASTQYHSSYEGGLCEHCLNVYDQLTKLVSIEYPTQLSDDKGTSFMDINNNIIDSDSIKIVALFHDFSKMNFYESYIQNKKVYSPKGSKYDEQGNYDWVTSKAYKVKDVKERFLFGTHGQNSEYMIGTYIPLKLEESIAIIWHMGAMDNQNEIAALSNIYNRYSLAVLLHVADLMSAYISERVQ